MAKPVVRLTVNLSPEVAEALQALADKLDTTQTSALHEAILATAELQDEIERGGKVVVKDKSSEQEFKLQKGRPAKSART